MINRFFILLKERRIILATYIKTLQDGDGNFIAPRTNTDAITTPSGGSLSGLIVAGDDPITGSPIYTPIKTLKDLDGDLILPRTSAEAVSYNNTTSSLLATTTQTAIDEIVADLEAIDLSTKLNIAGGTMTGILVAQNNTSYTTKQVRNIIVSTADPVLADMANGDIWIKV